MTKRALTLELPVIALILGFTAVPLALQPIDWAAIVSLWRFGPNWSDIVANVLLFLPLGFVLAWRGVVTAVLIALIVSMSVEAIQFLSALRAPSLMDVATNVAGGALGALASLRWGRPRVSVALTRFRGLIAAILAALLALFGPPSPRAIEHDIEAFVEEPRPPRAPDEVNTRGAERAGRLEAHWTFDEDSGDRIDDVGPNGLSGQPVNRPSHIPGIAGNALQFNGGDQYIIIGNAPQLRLVGSMTVSAWINPVGDEDDDAAILSSLDRLELGFQFDTTTDQGPRAIALKLTGDHYEPIARYGRTTLQANRWYHVAGVYDAQARTLDVFVNGRRDNGCLAGVVRPRQLPSEQNVFIGRRAEYSGSHFAGALDDVRVYSRALSAEEVAALFRETRPASFVDEPELRGSIPETCSHDHGGDPTIAGVLVFFGQLAAFAFLALWPRRSRYIALPVALAAGLALIPMLTDAQPLAPVFFPPLLALLGAASVVAALRVTEH